MATAAATASRIREGPAPGEPVCVVGDDGATIEDTDDALTAEFRHRLGLLPEEDADLTDAFKARIGLLGPAGEQINEVQEMEMKWEEEREETLSQFKMSKFAKQHFQGGATLAHTKSMLKAPLLAKHKDLDKMASLAVWKAIQRFMGDAPSPPIEGPKERMPIMTMIYKNLERHALRRQSSSENGSSTNGDTNAQKGSEPYKMRKKSSWKKYFGGGSRSGSSSQDKEASSKEVRRSSSVTSQSSTGSDDVFTSAAPIMDTVPVGDMDLIHFIIGHGILRRELRDEIYCQVCRQTTKNPSEDSSRRGWMLQALCAGSFLPSDQLGKYYRSFLRDAPPAFKDYAAYTRRTLKRTAANGMRYHPPNWLEFQATKMRKYVMLPVQISDGTVESLESDSATTASEMIVQLANSLGLKDQFGFSVYICIFDKVSSLGSGLDHVMDAISECEQIMRSKGKREEEAPWRLYLRKEMFTPWHDPEYDEVSTRLVYQQICKGVRMDEYRLRSEEDMARFVAKRWYIEVGSEVIPGKLQSTLHDYIPEKTLSGGRSREGWTQAVLAAFNDQGFADQALPPLQVKWHVVLTSPRKWPLQFSGLFEAFKLAGPHLPKNDVVIAVSSCGFFVLDEPFQVVLALHFYEIVEIFSSRSGKSRGQSFSLMTVKGDEYTFVSPNAETITKLVMTFLDGLRRRSKWAVGLQDFILEDHVAQDKSTFSFRQGDIIELLDEVEINEKSKKEEWLYGRCERTKIRGQFPFECVYVLPTYERPPNEFLSLFVYMSTSDTNTLPRKRGAVVISKGTIGRHDGHGLETAA